MYEIAAEQRFPFTAGLAGSSGLPVTHDYPRQSQRTALEEARRRRVR
jgi:hypothetical protein